MLEAAKNGELVSALVDGQLCAEEFADAVEWVGSDETARSTWHAYHLVGDVMRSGDSMAGGLDAAFMDRLRMGLQRENPRSLSRTAADFGSGESLSTKDKGVGMPRRAAANESRYRWRVVAGMVSLALVSLIGWQGLGRWDEKSGTAQLAQVPAPVSQPALFSQAAVNSAEAQLMIRDPQLDALLAAHKQFGGTSALQMPAGFMRNATFEGTAR